MGTPVTDSQAEDRRLEEARTGVPWRRWGPYLSERQWGTVREDYSADGDAWGHFTHDQARSRTYRRGEDGLAGFSDDKQRLCFALALWNERDAILKERVFGLANGEGNHGEDAKEYWFYLDSTPTHSYMKWLYKYPQRAFPYEDLVRTNASRSRHDLEYELVDTGVFDDDRYFDVFVEYAKAAPEDVLVHITAFNRGPDPAPLHLLPTLWLRNTWAWSKVDEKPSLRADAEMPGARSVVAMHPELGDVWLYAEGSPDFLFTENETNREKIEGNPNVIPYVKDAFHRYLIHGEKAAVNPSRHGTKTAAHVRVEVPPGASRSLRLRLTLRAPAAFGAAGPFAGFDEVFAARLAEADAFYESITPPTLGEDERRVMRQALAGMLWTKQYYNFNVGTWLEEHGAHPLVSASRKPVRNRDWFHMRNNDVVSMPDKWEYPWYATWDLAFHTIPLSMVDPDFARNQLELLLRDAYLHPSGQLPAYEWNFSDANPPVHPWATLLTAADGEDRAGELAFLKASFQRLLLNFTWWTNRKDPEGKNVFEGGFLGLDNIGVFDRSAALPAGGHLEQADGTAWMAFYSQNMLQLALHIAEHDPAFEDMALKFLGHLIWIATAMNRTTQEGGMWDEEEAFFYDVLRLPDGTSRPLKVRSMVGLLPFCAVTVVPDSLLERLPRFADMARDLVRDNERFLGRNAGDGTLGVKGRHLLSVLSEKRLRRVLARLLDEAEFLSPYGIRSLSRFHQDHPFVLRLDGSEHRVEYVPAESNTGMFGGNSNWRGPIWFPVNFLILRALLAYYTYYGDEFKVECPTRSGREMTLFEVTQEVARRLCSIFLRDDGGRRPLYGGTEKFQSDPHWKDLILFYEYFHGDKGAGLGASHQTGWTGLVARLLQLFAVFGPQEALAEGSQAASRRYRRPSPT